MPSLFSLHTMSLLLQDHYEDSSSWEVQSDYNPNDFTSPKSVEIKMVTSGNTNAAGNARSVQTENGGVTYLNAQPSE